MTDMGISRFLPLILVPVLVSCEKELDFDYRDIDPILVIEASLDDLGARVSLTETTPMDQPMDRTRLTDAVVTVEDLTAGDMLPLVPDEDGLYVSQFAGVTGHEYRLNVRRGDKTYASECVMPEKVVIENMEFGWIRIRPCRGLESVVQGHIRDTGRLLLGAGLSQRRAVYVD